MLKAIVVFKDNAFGLSGKVCLNLKQEGGGEP
jgi:hypothetical protein